MNNRTIWVGSTPVRRSRRGPYALLTLLGLVIAGLAALAVLAVSSRPTLSSDPVALARIGLPFGGGTIQRVSVVGGREQKLVPTRLRGERVWPTSSVDVGERVTVEVLIKRPSWLSWLTGGTQRVRLTLVTPTTGLRSQYLTVRGGQPLRIAFRQPVSVVEYATGGRMHRQVLGSPQRTLAVPVAGSAGTLAMAAAPRTWEAPRRMFVSWFPPGAAATAVARPAPGTSIRSDTPITLTFSKPVAQALGSHLPAVSPATTGTWHTVNSHTITFQPVGYGYGLGASISIPLPSGIRLLGGRVNGSDPVGHWSVPGGSTLRLQQILARLGYLPLTFRSGAAVAPNLTAEVKAAVHPPSGSFAWRYPNTPSPLRSAWSPGSAGVITRGAVMAFENDHGMATDGVAGAQVWKALLAADIKDQVSNFGYTYVMVSEGHPESINVWHSGHTVLTGPVNTGVAKAPTATGVYPVFEHLTVTTMSGTNPDGSHYSDPGIPWVSYFNGGDALHGFIRASYGFPQSDGCVEMPYAQAHRVFPYTPIGTLVNVS